MSATVQRKPRAKPAPVQDWRAGLDPATQLRVMLERSQRNGRDFDDAWDRALASVKWPHLTAERVEWRAILVGGRHHWRAAYNGLGAQRPVDATRRLTAA